MIPKSGYRFSEKIMRRDKLERDDDSKKSHLALTSMSRLRAVAVNSALVVGSLVFLVALCELVVFRFVLLASDVPANAFVDGLVRYAPSQAGIWRVRNEIAAPYAINAQGWNSGAGDYRIARTPGVRRIAVIGDSYVEAMQVAHDRSLAERAA